MDIKINNGGRLIMAKENKKQSPKQSEKVVTKYDLKKQRREEAAKREKRNAKIARITTAVVLIAIIVTVAVASWTRYYRVNKEYIVVNNESVSEVEFDLYYNLTKANVMNTYGQYLSQLYKYDSSKSDKLQNFSDDQTWYDYFGNMTIDNIKVHKALLQIADEKNFEYTAYDEDLAEFKDSIKSAADEASLSVADYYKQNFGKNVTEKKIEKYLYDYCKANAVQELLTKELAATDSEIDSYYSQNKKNYDTVAYRSLTITATDASDQTAMTAAKNKANEMYNSVTDEDSFTQLCVQYADNGDDYKNDKDKSLTTGYKYSSSAATLGDWLFDESRTAGNKNVIEDTTNGTYTVVYFISRTAGKDSNKNAISQTVLSSKYQEYITNYTDSMTSDAKNRIKVSE